jgi:hypothetical protein
MVAIVKVNAALCKRSGKAGAKDTERRAEKVVE